MPKKQSQHYWHKESKCMAVKVIDDRGNELMTVKTLEEVE